MSFRPATEWQHKLSELERRVQSDLVSYPTARARLQILRRLQHLFEDLQGVFEAADVGRSIEKAWGTQAKQRPKQFDAWFDSSTEEGSVANVVNSSSSLNYAFYLVGVTLVSDGAPGFPARVVEDLETVPTSFHAYTQGRQASYRSICESVGKVAFYLYEVGKGSSVSDTVLSQLGNAAWDRLLLDLDDYELYRNAELVGDRNPRENVWRSAQVELEVEETKQYGVAF